ncbi:MAG: tetraacyldisaccharide 4'-kinase [Crocinitomicaceae bacterium]
MLRRLLFPISLIWWIVNCVRNFLYDTSLLKSYNIPHKSIVVGNLSVGGTGKTPMVIYLTKLLSEKHELQILSRGYGRKTNGYLLVNEDHTSIDVGDEPLLYFNKFKKNTAIAVSENRADGVRQLRKIQPKSVVILDDAFQHRKIKAGFSVLLTTYNSLFSHDFLLPAGNLREGRSGAKRSDIIVVTKCPLNMTEIETCKVKSSLSKYNKPIYFSCISYSDPISFGNSAYCSKNVLLVTGIAKPEPLIEFLSETSRVEHISYPDHHNFSANEIQKIHEKIDTFVSEKWSIITTEKDYMRLLPFKEKFGLSNYPWFYIPIEMKIENENDFNQLIIDYVRTI